MANFVAVVDPDPGRRDAFLRAVAPQLPLMSGLVTGERAAGDAVIAWAAGARAPVTSASDSTGAAALFGDALLGDAGARLDAAGLRAHWLTPNGSPGRDVPPPLDGYHAGVVYDARRGLVAGADLLGWFPLYWFAGDGALVVASSAEAVRHHPACRTAVDPAALAGVLMLNGLLAPPALLTPIRRLPAGHLLRWTPNGSPCEVRQYVPASAWAGEDLTWHAYVERVGVAVGDAVRRHVGGAPRVGLMLSGGLDSRMLAGYLHAQGTSVVAMTQGIDTDVEMRCAAGVARELGFRQHRFEVNAEQLPEYAERSARWEHLAGGFTWVSSWEQANALQALPDRVVAGYAFDHLLHANTMTPPEAVRTGRLDFATAFGLRNGDGVEPAVLRRLFAPTFGADVVDDVLSDMGRTYAGYAATDFRRYWAFSLADRVRNHIGSTNWRASFASWPVVPALDRALLDAIASLPVAAMSGRRLQREVVRQRFPRLATLPLDHNSRDDMPIDPTLAYRLRQLARARVARLPLVGRAALSARGTRFSWRAYDFNSAGWRATRRLAEPHRARLGALVDPDVAAELLPPPDTRVAGGRPRPGGRKLLLGLALWCEGRV